MKFSKRHFFALPVLAFLSPFLWNSQLSPLPGDPLKLSPTIPEAKESLLLRTDQFIQSTTTLLNLTTSLSDSNSKTNAVYTVAFEKVRSDFKAIEAMSCYFAPSTSKLINGPLIDEIEEQENNQEPIVPEGIQVIMDRTADGVPPYRVKTVLMDQANSLKISAERLRGLFLLQDVSARHLTEGIRLEILRITALSITGFDAPVPEYALLGAEQALFGMIQDVECVKKYAPNEANASIALLRKAAKRIAKKDFETFDRLDFIRNYLNPAYASITTLESALGVDDEKLTVNGLSFGMSSPFEKGAVRLAAYTRDDRLAVSEPMVELGQRLFYDPVLSGNGQRTCANCHSPKKAFADGEAKSMGFGFNGTVLRNAPTLINAALQAGLFHDARASSLEDQISSVVGSDAELHANFDVILPILVESEEYVGLFHKAFPAVKKGVITDYMVRQAIASYERTLIALNTPFDKYIRGESKTYSKEARRGFNLFMGKAQCATCHFLPTFSGNVPPDLNKAEWEVIGVPEKPDTANAKIDPDKGRAGLFEIAQFLHAFKTPQLRNVALTAPYMHNGVYQTLEQVMDFYNRGGGAGIGINLPNQTLPAEPLGLTSREQSDIIAFMRTLNDTSGLRAAPASLPKLAPANASISRKVGGIY